MAKGRLTSTERITLLQHIDEMFDYEDGVCRHLVEDQRSEVFVDELTVTMREAIYRAVDTFDKKEKKRHG